MFKLIRRFISLIFLVIIGIPSFFFGQVWYEAHFPDRVSANYAVVMGAAQYDGRPSDALEARLVEAKRLYSAGLVKKIVDRKSTRLNSSHIPLSRMPSSA